MSTNQAPVRIRIPTYSSVDKMHMVRPNLYLGSVHAAKDKQLLKSVGVTHILTMNGNLPRFPTDFEYNYSTNSSNDDRHRLFEHLQENIKFMHDGITRGAVFVHCDRGVNRSGSMVIAFLMATEGLNYEQALVEARTARPCVNPRSSLVAQLKRWERLLAARAAKKANSTEKEDQPPPVETETKEVAEEEVATTDEAQSFVVALPELPPKVKTA
eukprot:TRINITY_DN68143_c0_g1_i1.p1 TRINITY_DN68143_c0_g1~~TRINITY_DN68143_c0_g1_i1.p1  ORF type:complete len:214 (+),score=14.55 TRINITY_DN68143_c0_g1_i1:21-662(+)